MQAALAEDSSPDSFGLSYCRACVRGDASLVDGEKAAELKAAGTDGKDGAALESTWTLGSLAQALDFPLDTYRPLPGWAQENSSDELRKQKVDVPAKESAPKSISSANVGNIQHMEQRVQIASNISNLPQVQTLEDLDLFYSEDTSGSGKLAAKLPAPSGPGQAPTSLEQVSFAPPAAPVGPVGTAVFGEDDESDEESEEDDSDWKYCNQAAAPAAAAPAAAPEAAAAAPAASPEAEAAAPAAAAAPEPAAELPAAVEPAVTDTSAPATTQAETEPAPAPEGQDELL